MTTSKEKGNAFERNIAKKLNEWIFGFNNIILKRSSDSGAQKDIFCGDIIPVGQLPISWDGQFPFIFELKKGYSDDIPTPFRYETLKDWLKKVYSESLIYNQNIIFLIVQFTGREIIFFTNYDFTNFMNYIISFNIEIKKNLFLEFKCYKFKDLLKINFYDIFK
jgi:hypothetical protein